MAHCAIKPFQIYKKRNVEDPVIKDGWYNDLCTKSTDSNQHYACSTIEEDGILKKFLW